MAVSVHIAVARDRGVPIFQRYLVALGSPRDGQMIGHFGDCVRVLDVRRPGRAERVSRPFLEKRGGPAAWIGVVPSWPGACKNPVPPGAGDELPLPAVGPGRRRGPRRRGREGGWWEWEAGRWVGGHRGGTVVSPAAANGSGWSARGRHARLRVPLLPGRHGAGVRVNDGRSDPAGRSAGHPLARDPPPWALAPVPLDPYGHNSPCSVRLVTESQRPGWSPDGGTVLLRDSGEPRRGSTPSRATGVLPTLRRRQRRPWFQCLPPSRAIPAG